MRTHGRSRSMLNGLHHVWRAVEILAGADCGLRGRLQQARTEFVLSLDQPEAWPPELLQIARSIQRILRQDSDSDPLETMDEALARQVAEDLLSLAVDVLAAFSQEGQASNPDGPKLGHDGEHRRSPRVALMEQEEPGLGTE